MLSEYFYRLKSLKEKTPCSLKTGKGNIQDLSQNNFRVIQCSYSWLWIFFNLNLAIMDI